MGWSSGSTGGLRLRSRECYCNPNIKTKDPSTPVSRAEENAREPSSAQDDLPNGVGWWTAWLRAVPLQRSARIRAAWTARDCPHYSCGQLLSSSARRHSGVGLG